MHFRLKTLLDTSQMNAQCFLEYNKYQITSPINDKYSAILDFDEDYILHKTIELRHGPQSNLYYILSHVNGILVNLLIAANSVSELAKEIEDTSSDSVIIFASKVTDGNVALVVTDSLDSYANNIQTPHKICIDNDLNLIEDIGLLRRIYKEVCNGRYPHNAHTFVDIYGKLQEWYPYGGLKGHKNKLLAEGIRFIDDKTVDLQHMISINKWRTRH